MSRLSYGGDIFSPVRCDTSLNEDSFLEGRNSDIFFGTWDDLSLKNNSYQEKKGAEKNICKLATDAEQDKLTEGKETVISKQNRSSKSKLHENPIDINSSNGSSKEINSSVNKVSYVTTRKSSRSFNKTNKLNEESEGREKSSNRKQKVSKHITMRSSTQKSKIQLVEDFKENESFPNSAFPTLTEENTDASIDSYRSNKDNLIQHLTVMSNKQANLQPQDIQSEKNCAHTLAEPAVKQITPQSEVLSFNNNHKSGVTPSKVNCESQTDLLMSELSLANNDLAAGKHGLNAHENQGSNLFALQNSNQSQQIQAGIIEKLVKDTVSFEFDSIRQMLYMQQLSLFRHLDRNAEAMKQNSYDCDILCKIINELMEENKHLRRIISNQNC